MNTTDSILDSVKKMLGIEPDCPDFDVDIIIAINSALSTLAQIVSGLDETYHISDSTQSWSEFVDDRLVNMTKNYVFISVKLVFDPPTSSSVASAYSQQLSELAWRIQSVPALGNSKQSKEANT